MRENIIFKGVNGELQLILNESADFSTIVEQLKNKLESAAEFFSSGMIINLPGKLTASQRNLIVEVLHEHGLDCKQAPAQPEVDKITDVTHLSDRDNYEITAVVVNKTLRSGQKVVHDGSVIVFGDVNPGAQVIAGQDIIILGSCRGMAHAGAKGNEKATITANKIVATQLRIAGIIARSPDDQDKSVYVQTARIKDGAVIIEPVNRWGE